MQLHVVAVGVVVGLAVGIVPGAPAGGAATVRADPDVTRARAALSRMPLADRVSQLIMTSVPGGPTLRPMDARVVARSRFGGIVLFADNYSSRSGLLRFTRSLQAADLGGDASRPRALVSIDQEGGVVKRIADAPPTRSAPQLGALDRPAVTRAEGRATAKTLRGLGVQVDLAPVADLDIAPRHVMRARSFGSDPALVGRHVAAFIDGIHAGRGAAAVKHFPGFGGASVNSDDALATITRTAPQLERDLAPFRSAIGARVDLVMVSHGRYTAIDRLRPASTSPATYRQLRGELGFDGVTITDSLHARGFAAATHLSVPFGCVRAIAAGADIALLTGSLKDAVACRSQLVVAARAGRLTNARIDEAALRVLVLKSRLGLLGR